MRHSTAVILPSGLRGVFKSIHPATNRPRNPSRPTGISCLHAARFRHAVLRESCVARVSVSLRASPEARPNRKIVLTCPLSEHTRPPWRQGSRHYQERPLRSLTLVACTPEPYALDGPVDVDARYLSRACGSSCCPRAMLMKSRTIARAFKHRIVP